jgi:acetate kinase
LSAILCVNGGSSSLKVALYEAGGEERRLAWGRSRNIGQAGAELEWNGAAAGGLDGAGHSGALRRFSGLLAESGLPAPSAIGHRIVHGGEAFDGPRALTPEVAAELEMLIPLAPLHLPIEIALLEACSELWLGAPQVLCFDTAFHRRMPEVAQRLPLPRRLAAEGVRRYGFHGISYEYVLEALGAEARGRVILAHLGAGASLAAVLDGRPIDTTMGLTPAGGLMMATRSGDLDPGVVVHLLREKGYDAATIDRLVNEESGLLGVSGQSADMATLLRAAASDPHARESVESFCYIARKHIGAMAAALGGVDMLVFTAGIGENAPEVRARICDDLGYLGIVLDDEANRRNASRIDAANARCGVRVVPTNEELHIARRTAAFSP